MERGRWIEREMERGRDKYRDGDRDCERERERGICKCRYIDSGRYGGGIGEIEEEMEGEKIQRRI